MIIVAAFWLILGVNPQIFRLSCLITSQRRDRLTGTLAKANRSMWPSPK